MRVEQEEQRERLTPAVQEALRAEFILAARQVEFILVALRVAFIPAESGAGLIPVVRWAAHTLAALVGATLWRQEAMKHMRRTARLSALAQTAAAAMFTMNAAACMFTTTSTAIAA